MLKAGNPERKQNNWTFLRTSRSGNKPTTNIEKNVFVSVCIKSKLEAGDYTRCSIVRTDSVFFQKIILREHNLHESICSDWPVCVTF